MLIANIPAQLLTAFSAAGNKAAIPQTTASTSRASYALGFPPLNMTPLADGGVAPDGRDMNGILYEVSNAAMWAQAMGVMPFDAAFAASAGYPNGALVQYSGSIWRSTADSNSVTPSAVSANWERMSLEGGTAGQALMKISSKTGDYSWRALTTADVASLQSTLDGKAGLGGATPLMDGSAAVGVGSNASREDHVHPTDTTRAPIASPMFTGTPAAPTATAGTNTTQIATTAFVTTAVANGGGSVTYESSTANIKMDGSVSVGTLSAVPRSDHVHPTDTTRAPLESPTFTGTPAAPTATAGTNTTQLATTEFVQGAFTDPVITGCIKEDVYGISDAAGFEIDPSNGSLQTVTLSSANRTPKGTNFGPGKAITLMVWLNSAYTITWTDTTFGASGVKWVGGSAPALVQNGYNIIELWRPFVSPVQVYGAFVGVA